jgi:tRNA G18 (ribose-2'-O)-methylase SpoU
MHNVGSILRTADAFRIEKVYLCGITPKPPHREIRKTAIGAEESVDWEAVEDIDPLIRSLRSQGYQILSVEQTDASVDLHAYEAGNAPVAVILGHEVDGVRESVVAASDLALEIPQFGTKHSLNVSVAAGIVLHHLVFSGKKID